MLCIAYCLGVISQEWSNRCCVAIQIYQYCKQSIYKYMYEGYQPVRLIDNKYLVTGKMTYTNISLAFAGVGSAVKTLNI